MLALVEKRGVLKWQQISTQEHRQRRTYRKHSQENHKQEIKPEQKPAADFFLCDGEKAEEVYAYCNLHGLWKA